MVCASDTKFFSPLFLLSNLQGKDEINFLVILKQKDPSPHFLVTIFMRCKAERERERRKRPVISICNVTGEFILFEMSKLTGIPVK